MALRVLLADESTTIKKVMQLALQDFAVEVKAVQSGVDVAEVARSFKPDILFIDVLLPKKNGYEVARETKADSELAKIPCVLMWSSFMDLDEASAQKSGAEGRLEKPFDVETIRSLVKELVPRTQSQRLAHFLQFPADFVEPVVKEENAKRAKQKSVIPDVSGGVSPQPTPAGVPPLPPRKQQAPPPLETSTEVQARTGQPSNWNMDNFDPLPDVMEHFKDESVDDEPVKITKLGGGTKTGVAKPTGDDGDPWSHQDLARFKLDIPQEDVEHDEISIVFDMNQPEPKGNDFLLNRSAEVTRTTARIQLPKLEPEQNEPLSPMELTQPQIDPAKFQLEEPEQEDHEPTHAQYQPVSEIPDVDGGMISQFDLETADSGLSIVEEDLERTNIGMQMPEHLYEPLGEPQLTEITQPPQRTSAAGLPSQMNVDELERLIRAQSREVIEAVVQRVVPELAREMIRQELDRLLQLESGNRS
jgi:CheY-like chemotaxis protein